MGFTYSKHLNIITYDNHHYVRNDDTIIINTTYNDFHLSRFPQNVNNLNQLLSTNDIFQKDQLKKFTSINIHNNNNESKYIINFVDHTNIDERQINILIS